MKNALITLFFSILLFQVLKAQNHIWCGHDMVTGEHRKHIENYDAQYFNQVREILQEKALSKTTEEDVYTIQVVVHILYEKNDKYQNIPDSIIQSQIDALNRDFRLKNSDTSKIRDVFKDLATDVGINFQLAKRDPNNQPTNGITRKRWNGTTLLGPLSDPFLKNSLFGGQSPWPTQRYLNIWVCDLNKNPAVEGGFLAGYAFPPPDLPGWPPVSLGNPQTDGVVIDYRFFGDNNHVARDMIEPVAVFNNMGRTTVHEVGHYLGLRHVWGDIGTLLPEFGCLVDDGIDDTPNAQLPTGGGICYANPELNSCIDSINDKPDMYENYMDYSGDPCYAMFSRQQADLMRWVLFNRRNNIILKNVEATALTTDITACKGDTVELAIGNTRDDYQYIWNGTKAGPKIKIAVDKDSVFNVEVKNAFNTKTFTMRVFKKPSLISSATADFDATPGDGNQVSFSPKDKSKTNYLWDFGDGNTSTETEVIYEYADTGSYIVRLSIANTESCDTFYFEKTVEVEGTSTTVDELIKEYGIVLYPNPTRNELTVSFKHFEALIINQRQIIDISGRIYDNISYEKQYNQLKINTRQLGPGRYFLEFKINDDIVRLPFIKVK